MISTKFTKQLIWRGPNWKQDDIEEAKLNNMMCSDESDFSGEPMGM